MDWAAPIFSVNHSAMVRAEPESAISLPKIAPSRNSGKNWIR